MVRVENDCVGCPQGCINCGRKYVEHFYCDKCGEEDTLYESYNGEQLCKECLIDVILSSGDYPIVEGSDCY
jgi:hypothetical protein